MHNKYLFYTNMLSYIGYFANGCEFSMDSFCLQRQKESMEDSQEHVVDYDTEEEDENNVDKDKKSSFKHYHLQLQKSKK